MAVKITQPARNLREELNELRTPTGIAGEAMMRADTPQEQFNLIGAGRKNLIINGAMQVSQRGDFTTPSAVSNTTYFVDRWYTQYDGGITANTSHNKNVLVNSGYTNTVKVEATNTNADARMFVRQPIEATENKGVYAGQTVTLSAWVRSNRSDTRLVCYDYASGSYIQNSPTHSGSGDWEYLSWTFTFSSADTQTAGRFAEVAVALVATSSVGVTSISSGDYLEFTNVQLELGKVATPFEHRSYGEELALCQRYYFAETANDRHYLTQYNASFKGGFYSFPSVMRSTPTIVTKNDVGGAVTLIATTPNSVGYYIASATSDNTAHYIESLTADAEL